MELNVTGMDAAVVGGDIRAAGQVSALLAGGARVTVVAAELTASLEDLAHRGLLAWLRDPGPHDLTAYDLVLRVRPTATDHEPGARTGSVTLVGGGPGDPGLLTVAGRAAIESADVIVTDRLAPIAALGWARPGVQVVDVAKIPGGRSTSQDEINRLLVEHATSGRHVVRLKGGDSFVFGRGGEELLACHDAGIRTRVVPGVTSAIAAPALAGIPVTHRGLTQGFTVVSGHVPPGHPESTLDYAALARSGSTLVVLMGVRTLGAICAALTSAGLDPATPAAVVADGALPSQQVVRATLDTIDAAATAVGIGAPAVAVIGSVVDIPGLDGPDQEELA
ncbi:uroporphyrinogen-III C-methyltransferase [Aeromicrobium chenweiae]|uniref:uroporphyrinogen-III C-methyltransferase n=1 Tax=Aeromicrobium chenweiae TaxID=2079793 RepID=A0A2S0WQN6_9ACTN|nr:uroporphyrinogen-III C-methyltransferase [Aeromicrobium chenweiae]AWB93641.1 uroporphyrinogen-III C-methyltransferase [Aeromicrobium chenweiae]TGN30510.1 uroporphyrinogen-III C-methyltransferase [Aeromicrobium chenweiae]